MDLKILLNLQRSGHHEVIDTHYLSSLTAAANLSMILGFIVIWGHYRCQMVIQRPRGSVQAAARVQAVDFDRLPHYTGSSSDSQKYLLSTGDL